MSHLFRHAHFRVGATVCLLTVMPTLFACGDDEIVDPPVEKAYADATTADQLVENFARAYAELDLNEYDRVLDDSFQFWFSVPDSRVVGAATWDRATEFAAARNMFSGRQGSRPDGSLVPAVQSITMTLVPAEAAWVDATGELVNDIQPVPDGTLRRRYSVDMLVRYATGDVVSQVNGQQLLYAVADSSESPVTWKIVAWQDFGTLFRTTSSENQSWGLLKWQYR